MSINGLKTAEELRGRPCIRLVRGNTPRKMITVSRSFGGKIYDKATLKEALANFAHRAGVKLREDKLLATQAYISLYRDLSAKNTPNYKDTQFLSFPYPTDSTLEITRFASRACDVAFQENVSYRKCSINLVRLIPKETFIHDLFDERDINKNDALMHTIDSINQQMGSNTIQTATAKGKGKWVAKKDSKSKCFTTRWDELPLAV